MKVRRIIGLFVMVVLVVGLVIIALGKPPEEKEGMQDISMYDGMMNGMETTEIYLEEDTEFTEFVPHVVEETEQQELRPQHDMQEIQNDSKPGSSSPVIPSLETMKGGQ